MTDWARGAKVVVVDIDAAELEKFGAFGKTLDLAICADAGDFLDAMLMRLPVDHHANWQSWNARIAAWKAQYPVRPERCLASETVNPYVLVEQLSAVLPDNEQVFIDTGCAIAWMMQGFPVRDGQRLYHDFNNTAMGWALPAAIGGSLALGSRAVTCVVGDGSLMMNLQELATVRRHDLPIRIFLLNNAGYSMVQQTQDQWLGGNYAGTSYDGGIGFPNFALLAQAFAIDYLRLDRNASIGATLKQAMAAKGPVLIDVRIPSAERVLPQAKFGYPIEDAEPLIPRDEFFANMIVAPLPVSMKAVK